MATATVGAQQHLQHAEANQDETDLPLDVVTTALTPRSSVQSGSDPEAVQEPAASVPESEPEISHASEPKEDPEAQATPVNVSDPEVETLPPDAAEAGRHLSGTAPSNVASHHAEDDTHEQTEATDDAEAHVLETHNETPAKPSPEHSELITPDASVAASTPNVTVEETSRADTIAAPEDVPTPTADKSPELALATNIESIQPEHLTTSSQAQLPNDPVSPMTPCSLYRTSLESMTSIALTDAGLDYDTIPSNQLEDALATPRVSGIKHSRKPSSLDIIQSNTFPLQRQSTFFDTAKEASLERRMSSYDGERNTWASQSAQSPSANTTGERNNSIAYSTVSTDPGLTTSSRSSSVVGLRRASHESWPEEDAQVDWQALDKTEEQEKEDKDLPSGVEDESTAFLLARLEQENAKFNNDPKAIARARANSRPLSMAHIKKLVTSLDAPTIRYSLVPALAIPDEPPPMTELEFWAALVQDYPSTAARLPTLTATKIRAGIPPPLRGVVWASMAGARDKDLEESFEKLAGEKSPYEGIINKDVGRSFPGVELFRDAEGDGQRMLGKVLKCFSLQDQEIGYCQGLGFLVGPLLMNMGESEAFCVLVRLMDHYSLRPSFLPSLAGLHMRIYQFTSLLKKHHRTLHDHLSSLGVEPAYLSQWFLSCFAVTCPLPMLFRIYDVIFAEGANETVMRVALALMRRHEDKMLEASEFEEVMQLLLGREIWDCYGGDADLLVDDFTSLGDTVTHSRLAELEKEYTSQSTETVVQSAGILPDVQSAASRFLGRLWAPGHVHNTSKPVVAHNTKASVTTLSPPSTDKDPGPMGFFSRQPSFLRRSPSKQSITAITDSQSSDESASSAGSGSSSFASTAPTEHDLSGVDGVRQSYADTISSRSKAESIAPTTPSVHTKEQQELHGQIEDLLTALSEMQREHAQLAAMLQREREERSEDHRSMREVVGKYQKTVKESRRRTAPSMPRTGSRQDAEPKGRPLSVGGRREAESAEPRPKDDIEAAVDKLQDRLDANSRFSFNLETKAQLRGVLARTREQLGSAEALSRDLHGRLESAEGEGDDLRSEVKELRARVADDFKIRQKLEHQLRELQAKARSTERKQTMVRAGSLNEVPAISRTNASGDSNDRASVAGLRELKLGRRDSSSSIQSVRFSRQPSQLQIDVSQRQRSNGATITIDPASPSPIGCDTPDSLTTPISAVSPMDTSPGLQSRKNRMSYGKRTSSLITKEVLATPEHEPAPEESLLLELINSKTSEAQARNEVDELKKALSVGKRKQDEAQRQHEHAMEQLRAELAAVKAEALKAAETAQSAKAESAMLKLSTASVASTPIFSLPPTPYLDEAGVTSPSTPGGPIPEEKSLESVQSPPSPQPQPPPAPKPTESVSSVGSWFWGRRTTSKTNIPTVQKDAQ